jgi:hypothetical protein
MRSENTIIGKRRYKNIPGRTVFLCKMCVADKQNMAATWFSLKNDNFGKRQAQKIMFMLVLHGNFKYYSLSLQRFST